MNYKMREIKTPTIQCKHLNAIIINHMLVFLHLGVAKFDSINFNV